MKAATILVAAVLPSASAFSLMTQRAAVVPIRAPVPMQSACALTTGTASLVAASGIVAWVAPKANTDGYGITSDDGIGDSAYYQVRQVGAWQLVNAFIFIAGLKSAQTAATASHRRASRTSVILENVIAPREARRTLRRA